MVEGSTMVRHRPLTMPYHRATIILQKGFQYLIVHKRMTPHEMTRARGGSSCSKHKTKLQAYHTLSLYRSSHLQMQYATTLATTERMNVSNTLIVHLPSVTQIACLGVCSVTSLVYHTLNTIGQEPVHIGGNINSRLLFSRSVPSFLIKKCAAHRRIF